MQFARLTTKTSNVTDHVSFQSSDTANAATAAGGVFPAVDAIIRPRNAVCLGRRENDDD